VVKVIEWLCNVKTGGGGHWGAVRGKGEDTRKKEEVVCCTQNARRERRFRGKAISWSGGKKPAITDSGKRKGKKANEKEKH